jgi:hypothetical protein
MSGDKKLDEIRARHEHKVRWLRDISALGPQSHEDRAFLLTEIERLRARIEVLERTLRHYADDAYNGHNGNGDCARAALEAKP